MFEERRMGQPITSDMRAASNESVNRIVRQQQVIDILTRSKEPMTAREVAVEMWRRGFTRNDERNNAAPRLTELCKLGIVEPIGKKICGYSGKSVTVFARRKVMKQEEMGI
jgi:repressor of nif and glnA expression